VASIRCPGPLRLPLPVPLTIYPPTMTMTKPLLLAALLAAFVAGCKDTTALPAAPSSSPSPTAQPGAPATTRSPDTLETSKGTVTITPVNHATFVLQIGGKAIWFDPTTEVALDGMPKASYILLTDIHPDHLVPAAIDQLRSADTVLIGPQGAADKVSGLAVMHNGEKRSFPDFELEAVPMYNLQRGPAPGKLFHDKGRGNGYILTLGGKRLYVSGDTECIPEMKALTGIDLAFVCMNLPYTMTPSEAAECVRAFKPKVVFPYHFRGSSPEEFQKLVGDASEVRIRKWY